MSTGGGDFLLGNQLVQLDEIIPPNFYPFSRITRLSSGRSRTFRASLLMPGTKSSSVEGQENELDSAVSVRLVCL